MRHSPLLAVDIGNTRIKVGLFTAYDDPLPCPLRWLSLSSAAPEVDQLPGLLGEYAKRPAEWLIGSVNRPAASRLLQWLRENRGDDTVRLLSSRDLPIRVELERPDMVGIDRLLSAVGANALRQPQRPAVVVGVGSAVTVNLVSPRGAFLGGAILPGIGMSARALHEFTDLLPPIDMADLETPPPALGQATESAMQAGLFWGAVGAIRELSRRMTESFDTPPQLFLAGGAAPAVAHLLGPDAAFVPHLTLGGIALARGQRSEVRGQRSEDRGRRSEVRD